uniref:Uncharacterized protein n=1 Tax=blood disease bacterium R229 TaxID=741978 RepID=G2ZS68_9RALS|nr:hypothetical protein BDB_160126 [blood disease bacterium R229]
MRQSASGHPVYPARRGFRGAVRRVALVFFDQAAVVVRVDARDVDNVTEYNISVPSASPVMGLSEILCARHIMRSRSHGYADEEETHVGVAGSGARAVA